MPTWQICNPWSYEILESWPLSLIFDSCANLSRLKHWLNKWNKSKSHEDRGGQQDTEWRRVTRVGHPESVSSGGLTVAEAPDWCAARPFEGIINTFWLLWFSCHRKYNLHQDYKIGGSSFLLQPPLGCCSLPSPQSLSSLWTALTQSNPLITAWEILKTKKTNILAWAK